MLARRSIAVLLALALSASQALAGILGTASGGNYPVGATPVANSATATGAAATATLPAAQGQVTFISGFEVTATNATAGSTFTVTVAPSPTSNLGIAGAANLVYEYTVVTTGATVAGPQPLIVEYVNPLPVSGAGATPAAPQNVAITVSATAPAGSTVAIVAHGYQFPSP